MLRKSAKFTDKCLCVTDCDKNAIEQIEYVMAKSTEVVMTDDDDTQMQKWKKLSQ